MLTTMGNFAIRGGSTSVQSRACPGFRFEGTRNAAGPLEDLALIGSRPTLANSRTASYMIVAPSTGLLISKLNLTMGGAEKLMYGEPTLYVEGKLKYAGERRTFEYIATRSVIYPLGDPSQVTDLPDNVIGSSLAAVSDGLDSGGLKFGQTIRLPNGLNEETAVLGINLFSKWGSTNNTDMIDVLLPSRALLDFSRQLRRLG